MSFKNLISQVELVNDGEYFNTPCWSEMYICFANYKGRYPPNYFKPEEYDVSIENLGDKMHYWVSITQLNCGKLEARITTRAVDDNNKSLKVNRMKIEVPYKYHHLKFIAYPTLYLQTWMTLKRTLPLDMVREIFSYTPLCNVTKDVVRKSFEKKFLQMIRQNAKFKTSMVINKYFVDIDSDTKFSIDMPCWSVASIRFYTSNMGALRYIIPIIGNIMQFSKLRYSSKIDVTTDENKKHTINEMPAYFEWSVVIVIYSRLRDVTWMTLKRKLPLNVMKLLFFYLPLVVGRNDFY